MGKDGQYANRYPARRSGVGRGAPAVGRENKRVQGKKRQVGGGLEERELMMLMQLVQWRMNMLTGLAAVDGIVAGQRREWERLLGKLEGMAAV